MILILSVTVARNIFAGDMEKSIQGIAYLVRSTISLKKHLQIFKLLFEL